MKIIRGTNKDQKSNRDMKRQWIHTDRQTTDIQAVLPKESSSHHFLICSQANPGSEVPACIGGCEMKRSLQYRSIVSVCFSSFYLVAWGQLWARQVHLVRNCYGAAVSAVGLPTNALGSVWPSDCLCWPRSHSLPWLLPLQSCLCKDTVAYKQSRNCCIKHTYFLCSTSSISSSQGHAAIKQCMRVGGRFILVG